MEGRIGSNEKIRQIASRGANLRQTGKALSLKG
jgi:hypothetical protein